MTENKIANSAATIAMLGGIFYAMKNKKGLGVTLVYGIGFGLAGMFIGNQVSKMGLI